jgi:GxxExxY protein
VYNALGFGFLEHVYTMALERELRVRGHRVAREVCVRVTYKGEDLTQQRIDMVVDEKPVVEAKSTYELHKAAPRQVFNYLRATNLEVGLLLHFGPRPSFFRLISSNKRSASSARSAASGRQLVIDAGDED